MPDVKIKKDGQEYGIGVVTQHYPADRVTMPKEDITNEITAGTNVTVNTLYKCEIGDLVIISGNITLSENIGTGQVLFSGIPNNAMNATAFPITNWTNATIAYGYPESANHSFVTLTVFNAGNYRFTFAYIKA